MSALTAAQLLDLWEEGQGRRPAARVLLALQAADPGGPADELPVARRDEAVMALIGSLPGSYVDAVTSCPACGELLEVTVPVDALAPGPQRGQDVGVPVVVETEGYVVACHPPTAGELARMPDFASPRRASAWLLQTCVDTARRGEEPVAATSLPASVVAAVDVALADSAGGEETTLSLECDFCGASWLEPFDPAPFLCEQIDRAAAALAGTVSRLAAAYGWTERDILALSDSRRALYLAACENPAGP